MLFVIMIDKRVILFLGTVKKQKAEYTSIPIAKPDNKSHQETDRPK